MKNYYLRFFLLLFCLQPSYAQTRPTDKHTNPTIIQDSSRQIIRATQIDSIRRARRSTARIDRELRAVRPQDKFRITGTVLHPDNTPMIGVQIMEKGTTNATTSDSDGHFSLIINPGSTLSFSFIGLSSIEIKTDNKAHTYSTSSLKLSWEVNLVELATKSGDAPKSVEPDTQIMINGENIPSLDFPPPKPSARYKMKKIHFQDCKRLKQVDQKLSEALETNGYDDNGYYSVPNGFAIVTKLEKINSDGTSRDIPERWDVASNHKISSFLEFFNALLFGSTGQYRLIVFIVTDKSFNTSSEPLSREQAEMWFSDGNLDLPQSIGEMEFTESHDVFALIYEFSKTESSEAELNLPSNLSGLNHLTQSKILLWLIGRR